MNQVSIGTRALFYIMTISMIGCQLRFDQVKWQDNKDHYRKNVLSTIENLAFLKPLTIDNYSEKLGQPKGNN